MAAASTAIRPIGHEERPSLVEHLDELRTRLIISVAALVVAFGVSAVAEHALLDILSRAAGDADQQRTAEGKGPLGGSDGGKGAARRWSNVAALDGARARRWPPPRRARLARSGRVAGGVAAAAQRPAARPARDARASASPSRRRSRSSAYFALLFSLPSSSTRSTRSSCRRSIPERGPLPLMAMVPSCSSPASCSATSWCCRRPSSSCRTSTRTSSTCSCRPGLLQVRGPHARRDRVVFQLPVGILAARGSGSSPSGSSAPGAATRSSPPRCWR